MSFRPRILIVGEPGFGQGSHLAPAVIHALEKFTVYTLDIPVLFGVSATSPEETCAQVICWCSTIRQNSLLEIKAKIASFFCIVFFFVFLICNFRFTKQNYA